MFLTRAIRAGHISQCSLRHASSYTPGGGQKVPHKVEKSINQITLLGRVGADPQKRGTPEHPVVTFALATHSNYQYESGDMLQKTDWHRVAVFKPYLRDSVYRYLTKGQRVLVQGRITYGDVKDEKGIVRTTTSIVADDVTFFNHASKNPIEEPYPAEEEVSG